MVERLDPQASQLASAGKIILVDVDAFAIGMSSKSNTIKNTITLSSTSEDALASLTKLAELLGTSHNYEEPPAKLDKPGGDLNSQTALHALAFALPEEAIVLDESNLPAHSLTECLGAAAKHDLLCLSGDAKGQSLPAAVGAAIACPDRPVFVLLEGTNAMPTIQALWTMAREKLDITVLVLNTARTKQDCGVVDFSALANGMGVTGERIETTEALLTILAQARAAKMPHLVELELGS